MYHMLLGYIDLNIFDSIDKTTKSFLFEQLLFEIMFIYCAETLKNKVHYIYIYGGNFR